MTAGLEARQATSDRRHDRLNIWNPWQADLGDWIRKTGILL